MQSFKRFLTEKVSKGKNTHLIHIEDDIFEDGKAGGRDALNFLESVVNMLAGSSMGKVSVTTKWDGAPAVFAGTNPENGKFFVATKSLFNVSPKVNHTSADIRRNHSGGLADKLQVALKELSKLGIKGILQGDMMFGPGDVKKEKIDGESMLTFTPNTITYAVPVNSKFGSRINKAKMGIVFHTSYSGKTIRDLKASFAVSVKGLKKTSSVWFDDATFRNTTGRAMFTASETVAIRKALAEANVQFRAVGRYADTLKARTDVIPDLNRFINIKVREGKTDFSSAEFMDWFMKERNVKIGDLKRLETKQRKRAEKNDAVGFMFRTQADLQKLFQFRSSVTKVKTMLVRKLEQIQGIGTFLRTDNGFKVTAPEGFVAVDTLSNKALKLVDRLEFSRNNFTAAKNWVKG